MALCLNLPEPIYILNYITQTKQVSAISRFDQDSVDADSTDLWLENQNGVVPDEQTNYVVLFVFLFSSSSSRCKKLALTLSEVQSHNVSNRIKTNLNQFL